MSHRYSIAEAITNKLKTISITNGYNTDLFNVETGLVFWDEVSDFPYVCLVPGDERRKHLPARFVWSFMEVPIKVYCKGETAQIQLEELIRDIEKCLYSDENLVYDTTNGYKIVEITIESIVTDKGLLAPYAVGEITAQVRYERHL